MKNLIIVVLFQLFVFQSFSSDWVNIRSENAKPAVKQLVSSNLDQSTIRFSMDGFLSQNVITPQGEAILIGLESATPIMDKGAPDLPKMTASVIIPDLALMQIEVIKADFVDFENILIAPSKGNLTRDIDPATIPYEFGSAYQQNAFYPGMLADLRDPYIVRDYRGQTVIVYPFRYNPVTRTLRVYTDITVKISKVNDTGANPLVRTREIDKVDVEFSHLYGRHFLNYGDASRYTPVDEFGKFLIISYGAFMEAMEPFKLWKTQTGYPVEMVDVGSIGNATAIKNYITDYYNTKGLTFVLLVGDAAQVPTSSTSAGHSDNNYAYIVGNDHYPDLFIGRFSAETVEQVQTQVERTLTYEQNPPTDVDWFTFCTGIASNQGPGDDGEYDYQHIRNIQNNKLIPFTYTYGNELFDGSQGGNDAPGNPTPAQVATAVNSGTSVINYTGHGSDYSWSTSGFSNSNVNGLENDNMLPFVWSVACVNGNFVGNTCFAEAWLRATHNGQPTGAIAFLGSTINQSWNPPMAGQDEMNDVLAESYQNNIKRTFGAISMHGCMLMNDEYGSGGSEMTDTWVCFGDPSVMVRTAMPQTLIVVHDPVLFLGSATMSVSCNAENARVTLTDNGTILSTSVVQDGSAMLEFAELTTPGSLTLTVTAFNHMPYITEIDVISPSGPHLVLESFQVEDSSGNNNGLADYNETIGFTLVMKNIGIQDAVEITLTLSSLDPYITITEPLKVESLIPAGETIVISGAFNVVVACEIPDQHSVICNMVSSDGNESWQSTLALKVNAPILSINSVTIDDTQQGNGNGELDPGETAALTFNYSNLGHATAFNVPVHLESQSGFVEVTDSWQIFPSIGFFGEYNKTFTVTIDEDAPAGIIVNFLNELTLCDQTIAHTFPLKISALCEDFETGDFSMYNWQLAGSQPWKIVFDNPYEGLYSIKSGVIAHNQSSEVSLTYETMQSDSIIFFRKVSSETSDYLKFFINNQLTGQWSGTTEGWKREAFVVEPGMQTFKWVYQKNGIGSAGSDCAWLDFIVLPAPLVLTIWAGPDDQVCTQQSYLLNAAYGTGFVQVEWSTSGSGDFNDPAAVNPVYYPSDADYSSGSVQLILNLWDDQDNSVSDDMVLGFTPLPPAPDTPQGPEYVDLAETQVTEYEVADVAGAESYIWYLMPEESGSITGDHTAALVTWNQEFTGNAMITVAGVNECGEGIPSPELVVNVENTLVNIPDMTHQHGFLKVYPNPAMTVLHVEFLVDHPESSEIRLTDMMGVTVVSIKQAVATGVIEIPVGHLAPGIYLLNVTSARHRVSGKVIVNSTN